VAASDEAAGEAPGGADAAGEAMVTAGRTEAGGQEAAVLAGVSGPRNAQQVVMAPGLEYPEFQMFMF
jgi:hypothetical protein